MATKKPATTEYSEVTKKSVPSVVARKTIKKTVPKATVRKTVKNASDKLQVTTAAASKRAVKADVVDLKGKVVESMHLPSEIFGAKINPTLMAQAVRVYLQNQRRGTVSTKTRGEVEGSTRKIYRQKGTGRARHGSLRAPIFVGGGLVFGPKQRDYSTTMPQKMRHGALFSALTAKLQNGEVKIVRGLDTIEPKTKLMYTVLQEIVDMKKPSILLIISSDNKTTENVTKAARNIEGITFLPANQLNTYEVLKAKQLVMMKDAVETMARVFTKGAK